MDIVSRDGVEYSRKITVPFRGNDLKPGMTWKTSLRFFRNPKSGY